MLDIHGLSSTLLFYKDALEKMGVGIQLFKVGTYKSFAESFTQTEMSDANREQITSFINDIWNNMKNEMAASRKLEPAQIDSIANQFPMLRKTDFLLASNLVDTLLYESEMKQYLRELLGVDADEKIPSQRSRDEVVKTTPAISNLPTPSHCSTPRGTSCPETVHRVIG
jgi:protease-4